MTHDQLHGLCFRWFWNAYPELRRLFWGNFNDIKQVEKIIGNVGNKKRMIVLSLMKGLGMVKGVVDFTFYYSGVLYAIDFKVGNDRLSKEQKEHIERIEAQGGVGKEIRTLEEFQEFIKGVITV